MTPPQLNAALPLVFQFSLVPHASTPKALALVALAQALVAPALAIALAPVSSPNQAFTDLSLQETVCSKQLLCSG